MLPTHWFYINTSCKDILSVSVHTGTKIIYKMLPLLFLVTSALSSSMAASFHQEDLQSMNDAPATISDRLYYMPTRGDQSSTNWDDESQRNLALIDRLENQAKRVHTGEQMSLSIMNPLDVLRQKLLLELSNRQFRQKQNQIRANYDYLRQIG